MYCVLKFKFHLLIIGVQESDRLLDINHAPGVFQKAKPFEKKKDHLCVSLPEVVLSLRGQCG